MKLEHFVVGPLQSNCYIIYSEKSFEALVIDPGDEAMKIIAFIQSKKLHLQYIVCTHAHFDHVGAVARLKEKTGARIVLHRDEVEIYSSVKDQGAFWGYDIDQPPSPDVFVADGDTLSIDEIAFDIIHTPGHSPGGICLFGEGAIITGDTVFAGSVGRTDFYGGSIEELRKSFKRIISLPENTRIFPGHGEFSDIKTEKKMNFFINEL